MERLTYKNYIEEYEINFEKNSEKQWSIAESDTHIKVTGEPIDKLAGFEDFMESLGCEELEELEHLIGYPRFIDGCDEQGNEINRTEFVTYKESFKEVFEKNKKLKQENQALKDRWNKLKEFVDKKPFSKGTSVIFLAGDILDKMQELERGETNAKD